jgi:hypothetical protein
LTDPIGLKASILTKRLIDGGASRLILTTGVRPIVSMMLPNRFPIVSILPSENGSVMMNWLIHSEH